MMKALMIAATCGLTALCTGAANAAYTVTYTQVDNDVRASGSGSLNIAGLSRDRNFDSFGPFNPFVQPGSATQVVGSAGFISYDVSLTTIAPAWGTSRNPVNGVGTGTSFYFNNNGQTSAAIIGVTEGYVSGSQFLSTATYANQTFASLGITSGTYTYAYGAGANSDTITFVFDPIKVTTPVMPAVPEPATWAMMLVGFGMVAGAARYRRRRVVASLA